MELLIKRQPSTEHGTFGRLYVDEVFACFSLEDEVREVAGKNVSEWKVKGETAIPAGRYKVIITHSNRFNRDLPLLLNVEGFTGIRIHPGNTQDNTEGCILVGTDKNETGLRNSRLAFQELLADMQEALVHGEEVFITIS